MKKTFPYQYYDTTILGILPAKSEFKVRKVFLEGSTGFSYISYLVTITKTANPEFQNWGVEPLIADVSNSDAPPFDADCVEALSDNSTSQ